KKGFDRVRNGGGLPSLPSMSSLGGRGISKIAGSAASKAGDTVGSKLKDTVSEKVDEAGGAGGLVKEAAGGLLPGGGGGGGDVSPGSLIEKAARGMRHVKRAVRADLHRFKAYIEMQENETGAWRGVIEDGELVEPHDESYDEERDYSEVDDLEGVYAESQDDD